MHMEKQKWTLSLLPPLLTIEENTKAAIGGGKVQVFFFFQIQKRVTALIYFLSALQYETFLPAV